MEVTEWSFPNCQFRARFILESLGNFKQIRDRGGKIEFLQGDTVEQISNLIKEYGASDAMPNARMDGKRPRMKKIEENVN